MKKKTVATLLGAIFAYLGAFGLCIKAAGGEVAVGAELPAMKIVLDAGHGGIDCGVMGKTTGVKESDLNLQIAFKIKSELTEAGFEVVMTRKTEGGLYDTTAKGFKRRDMEKRKQIVEEASPTLVLSIHQNFYPAASSRGGQVFYSPSSEKGAALASSLQRRLNDLYAPKGVKGRKEKAEDYFMLRFLVPAVIVECGFLSSPKDEELLISDSFQRAVAVAVVAGIADYFTLIEGGA